MKNKPNATVYLSNLSYDRDRNGIRSLMGRYGKIKSIKIIVEPTTEQSRGMAFVEMSSLDEAKAAIEGLTGQRIDGRMIKANYAVPLKEESKPPVPKKKVKEKEKDLNYEDRMLAKKARNDKKRKARPF